MTACLHCDRRIAYDEAEGRWVDPDATGDDVVWRETCDANDTFTAVHEPRVPDVYGKLLELGIDKARLRAAVDSKDNWVEFLTVSVRGENLLFPDGRPSFVDPTDLAARHLDGDEWLVVRPMITSMRLAVMTEGDASVEHWCFNTATQAVAAWSHYPNVPAWWTRHWHRDNSVSYPGSPE